MKRKGAARSASIPKIDIRTPPAYPGKVKAKWGFKATRARGPSRPGSERLKKLARSLDALARAD